MAKQSAKQKANTARMKMISGEAKKIYKDNPKMEWTNAIKKASTKLKKQGKL